MFLEIPYIRRLISLMQSSQFSQDFIVVHLMKHYIGYNILQEVIEIILFRGLANKCPLTEEHPPPTV